MASIKFHGKEYTKQDVLRAMANFDSNRRATFNRWKTYAVKHEGLIYPPKELLRMTVGDIGNLTGGEPTNHYFRELGFAVGDIDEDIETSDSAIEDAIDTQLHLESDLEEFLARDLAQLEQGLKLYSSGGGSGRQVDAGPAGRLDVLARDSSGRLVVIELKAGDADRQAIGQILAYMQWVRDNLSDGRDVRGILVAGDFTERAKLAAKVVPSLSLRKYAVNFRFEGI